MTLLWVVAVASLAAALAAWRRSRALAKRLEELSQLYWELRYQHGELRLQLQHPRSGDAPSAPESREPGPAGGEAFIPLSSLKR